jgi:hypothetical protein
MIVRTLVSVIALGLCSGCAIFFEPELRLERARFNASERRLQEERLYTLDDDFITTDEIWARIGLKLTGSQLPPVVIPKLDIPPEIIRYR